MLRRFTQAASLKRTRTSGAAFRLTVGRAPDVVQMMSLRQ
jgi:hypothetical protein